jgi:hypothetical protein
MESLGLFFALAIISSFVCGAIASHLAGEKGYGSTGWFFIGFFTWIVGVIAAAGLPDKKMREIFRNNIPSSTPSPAPEKPIPQAPDKDTWVCRQCFRVSPNSEEECYYCQTKRRT